MINHRIWKITGGALLQQQNTAGLQKADTLEEYDNAWLQREFGISIADYLDLIEQLRRGSVLWYEALFRNGELFG